MPIGLHIMIKFKYYTFKSFYGLLIKDQEKLLDEGKLAIKQQVHLPREKFSVTTRKGVDRETGKKLGLY